eukprot:4980001-Heterocapsa_arctica.AAC.1
MLDPEGSAENVNIEDCVATWDYFTNKMWLVKKPKADGTVEYRNLTSEQRMEFDISRRKEIDALVALGAFKILS